MRPKEKPQAEPFERTKYTHSGTMGSVPSLFATACNYLGIGHLRPLMRQHRFRGQTQEDFDAIQFSDSVSEHDLGETLAVPVTNDWWLPFSPILMVVLIGGVRASLRMDFHSLAGFPPCQQGRVSSRYLTSNRRNRRSPTLSRRPSSEWSVRVVEKPLKSGLTRVRQENRLDGSLYWP